LNYTTDETYNVFYVFLKNSTKHTEKKRRVIMNIKKMAVILATVLSLGTAGYSYALYAPGEGDLKKTALITAPGGERVSIVKQKNGVLIHNKSKLPIKVTTLRSVHVVPGKNAILVKKHDGLRTISLTKHGKKVIYHVHMPKGNAKVFIHKIN
jgi:hypothetical protein